MKYFSIYLAFMMLCFNSYAQKAIKINKDQCAECNMFIKDLDFAAQAIDENNSIFNFDAIECLVNFLKENDESGFSILLVSDYLRSEKMIPAVEAYFLKSKVIASPMGAYISAYSNKSDVIKIQKLKKGEIYTWRELKELFKDSRFGLLDHPTHHHHKPGSYAPIGIMGDHLHHKGGWMFSFRAMNMNMSGNLTGNTEIADMNIFRNYMLAPQQMNMRMYMIGAMYAPSDNFTLMIMQNYVKNSMDLNNMMGMSFSTESKGFGDLKVSALYGLMSKKNSSFHLNIGVNIPTGEIQNRYSTPMTENMKLPYPMQLGSGTFDYSLGGTYKGSVKHWTWGIQPMAIVRTSKNTENYRLGDQLNLNTWMSYDIFQWMSLSGRVLGTKSGEILGSDKELMIMMAPPANNENSGKSQVKSYLGCNFSFGEKAYWRNFKIGLEYGLPLYQEVNGIQMNEKASFIAGMRYSI
ncbi:MAG: transporter [Cytophagales bacterium]